jgi:raffinose/stachyose/melibiose transport system substrate-binding protein
MNKSSSRMRSRLMQACALALSASLVFAFNTPASSKTKLSGEIEFFHWRGEDQPTFQAIIDNFQKRNPGVKITQAIVPTSTYETTAVTRIGANKKIALFATLRARFPEYINANLMLDVSKEKYLRNFVNVSVTTGTVNGKVYAPFLQSLFNMPLYNTEIFAKEGLTPPRTWPGLLRLCKDLRAKGYTPMAWDGAFRPQAMQMINAMLANSMPDSFKSYGELVAGGKVTEPWFFDGVAKKFEEMHKAGCFPENGLGVTEAAANALFASGRAAIRPTGSFSVGSIIALNPSLSGKIKMMMINSQNSSSKAKWQGISNPQFGLAVNRNASKGDQAIAKAFIAYLSQPAVASQYANGTKQHVLVNRVNYSSDKDLANLAVWIPRNTLLAPRFQAAGALANAGNQIELMLMQIAAGVKTPAQAAAEYQPIIEQARP